MDRAKAMSELRATVEVMCESMHAEYCADVLLAAIDVAEAAKGRHLYMRDSETEEYHAVGFRAFKDAINRYDAALAALEGEMSIGERVAKRWMDDMHTDALDEEALAALVNAEVQKAGGDDILAIADKVAGTAVNASGVHDDAGLVRYGIASIIAPIISAHVAARLQDAWNERQRKLQEKDAEIERLRTEITGLREDETERREITDEINKLARAHESENANLRALLREARHDLSLWMKSFPTSRNEETAVICERIDEQAKRAAPDLLDEMERLNAAPEWVDSDLVRQLRHIVDVYQNGVKEAPDGTLYLVWTRAQIDAAEREAVALMRRLGLEPIATPETEVNNG